VNTEKYNFSAEKYQLAFKKYSIIKKIPVFFATDFSVPKKLFQCRKIPSPNGTGDIKPKELWQWCQEAHELRQLNWLRK